LGRSR